jgi:hypothetical protein
LGWNVLVAKRAAGYFTSIYLFFTQKSSTMRTKLIILAAAGLLAAGIAIHHSHHCPLMSAKAALTQPR